MGRPRHKWENNIRIDLEEIGINAGNWVDSPQDRNYWRALVNAALNLRVLYVMELVKISFLFSFVSLQPLIAFDFLYKSFPDTSLLYRFISSSNSLDTCVNTFCIYYFLGISFFLTPNIPSLPRLLGILNPILYK